MKRVARKAVAVGLVVGACAVGWASSGGTPEADDSAALPYLWHWSVPRLPGRGGPVSAELVLRHRADPFPDGPTRTLEPLSVWEADERVVRDQPVANPQHGGRLTVQLLDLGSLATSPTDPPEFLLVAGLATDGDQRTVARCRLAGHSVLKAVAHPQQWDGATLPLLTVRTISASEQHVYTLLLRMTDAGPGDRFGR